MTVLREAKATVRCQLDVDAVLAAAFLVVPAACVLADQSTVPTLLIAFAAAAPLAWRSGWRPRRPGPLGVAIAIFAGWALLAASWSFHPGESAFDGGRMVAVTVVAWLLCDIAAVRARANPDTQARLIRALAFGVGLAALLAVFELALDHPILRLVDPEPDAASADYTTNRGVSLLVMLVWIVLAGLAFLHDGRKRLVAMLLVGLSVAVAAILSVSATAQLALAGSALFALIAARHPGVRRAAVAAVLLLAIALPPVIVQHPWIAEMPESKSQLLSGTTRYRAHIWAFVADRTFERPIAGWGFDASRSMPNFGVEPFRDRSKVIPLHPHNAALQVWMELGAIGATLMLGVVAFAFRRLESDSRLQSALLASYAVATVMIANTGFGLWQSHWLASIGWSAVAAALVLARPGERPSPP